MISILWDGNNLEDLRKILSKFNIFDVHKYKLFYDNTDVLYIRDLKGNEYYIEYESLIRFSLNKEDLCPIPYFIYCNEFILYFDIDDINKITYHIKDKW